MNFFVKFQFDIKSNHMYDIKCCMQYAESLCLDANIFVLPFETHFSL